MKRKLIPALVCLALLTVLLPALSRPAEAESAPTVNLSFNKDPVRYDESFTVHYSITGGAAPYRDVSGVWEGLENGQWKSSNVVPLEGADGEASYALIPLEMTRVRFTVFGEDARGASFSGSVEAALIGDVEMFGDLTLQENRWEKVEIKCYLPADEAGRGQDVVWESSDPSVVSIDSYSQSTAILRTGKPGTATIHVYAWNRSIHRTAQVTVVEKMPTAITLSDARLSIGTGETKSLTASFTPADTSAQVTWTSSDERVATVDANGSVSGLQAGRAVIAAVTSNGLRAECQVTVSLTRPQSVSLDQSGTSQLSVGQALELHPSVTPAYATYALTWRSSNTRVATVENGIVKAVGEGAARITVTTDNGKSASLNVRVVDPYKPTGIALNQTGTVSLDIDKTLELGYHLIPETAQSEVSWRSSSDKVATVENGVVTPHREGTVTITVTTAKQNKRARVRVKVVDPYKPTGIALNQTGTVSLDVDKTLTLGYSLIPETAQSEVTWRSSSDKVATVENGVVTPHREGAVTITVTTAKQNKRATVRVKVVDPYKPTGIALNQTGTVSLDIDKTLELGYSLIPETARSEVSWRSSSDKVATVENGIVTPHREGTVTITVTTAKQHRRATVRVKVVDPYKPTGIALNQTGTVSLDIDKTLELGYSLIPETAQSEVTWRSSSDKVATVENGIVTPHKEGTVTITVTTAKQHRRATVRVKVVDPYKATAIAAPANRTVREGETFTLSYTLTPATATSPVTLTSGNKNAVQVNADGTLTALRPGTATVTLRTSTGRTARTRVTVGKAPEPTATPVPTATPAPTETPAPTPAPEYTLDELKARIAANTITSKELTDALAVMVSQGRFGYWEMKLLYDAHQSGFVSDEEYRDFTGKYGGADFKPYDEEALSLTELNAALAAGTLRGDELLDALDKSFAVGKISASQYEEIVHRAYHAGMLNDAQYDRYLESVGNASSSENTYSAEKMRMLILTGEVKGRELEEMLVRSNNVGKITADEAATLTACAMDAGLLSDAQYARLVERFGYPTAKPTPTPAPGKEAYAYTIEKLNMLVAAGEAEGDYLYECVRKSLQEGTITKAQGANFALTMVDNGLLTEAHWAKLNEEFGLDSAPAEPTVKPTSTPAPGEAFACSIEQLNMLAAAGENEDYIYRCLRKSLQEGTISKEQATAFGDYGILTDAHWANLAEEFGL